MVRVRLKAVILGVEDRHPPREARGVAVQVILMGLPQAAVRDPRVGDRDVRAGGRLQARDRDDDDDQRVAARGLRLRDERRLRNERVSGRLPR